MTLAAVSGCSASASGDSTGGGASCAGVVRYHGTRYLLQRSTRPPLQDRLGSGVALGCKDTPQGVKGPDIAVTAYRVAGVSPGMAIMTVRQAESSGGLLVVAEDLKPADYPKVLKKILVTD